MNSVCTVGFFDGVHLGHQYLLRQVMAEAEKRGGWESVALTFEQHPRTVLQADYQPKLLTTSEEKSDFIRESGISHCHITPFTPSLARLIAREFMEHHLRPLGVGCLVMGHDHHFGSDRCTSEEYIEIGKEVGIDVVRADAYVEGDLPVSSSRIRRLLEGGDVRQAALLLGRPYSLTGLVVEGVQMGRQIGFPTANLQVKSTEKLIPQPGVYATWAVLDGRQYAAMTNIGYRPTLQKSSVPSIETHLFGFTGNAYGNTLTLRFVQRLRDEKRFTTPDALQKQLKMDAASVQTILQP